MTDTHEKNRAEAARVFLDIMRDAPCEDAEGNACWSAKVAGEIIARALSKAHQDGIREGKRQAAEIAQTKADGVKACMLRYFEGGHCIDFQRYQEGCESVAEAILSTIPDESE